MVEITDPDVLRQSGEAHHPIISPSGNLDDEVPGVVFEVMPDALIAADGYEGADYKRILVTLKSGARSLGLREGVSPYLNQPPSRSQASAMESMRPAKEKRT